MIDPEQYHKAVQHVTLERNASTSFIQRKLQIGYNSAAALMERMEAEGIVGPANHVGKRDILVGPDYVPQVSEAAPAPAPAPAPEPQPLPETIKPAYTGPLKRFTCSGCDTTDEGPLDALPHGWHWQTTARLGEVPRCPDCALKNASRIATGRMSTEEILNAGQDGADTDAITDAAQNRLKSYVERFDRLMDDAEVIRTDISEVGKEAKGEGFDVKILMKVVRERRKDPTKRDEENALFDLYASAIGGLS